MRRLATDLDTGPASLDVCVRSTQEVDALLIDRRLADLDLSWNRRGDWRARLRRLLVDDSGVQPTHPAGEHLLGLRPNRTRNPPVDDLYGELARHDTR